MTRVTRTRLVLAVVAVVVLSGCSFIANDGGNGGTDAEPITDRVEGSIEETETLRATLIATTEIGNRTITERVRLRYERPQQYNLSWLEAKNDTGDTIAGAVGDAMIANGSQLWGYDAANETVTWLNATRPRTLGELLMPSRQFSQNVTFAGNETVAGNDAVKLSYSVDGSQLSLVAGDVERRSRLSSRMNESTPANATVWIDRDRWLPVKTRVTVTAFEDDITMTWRYEDIERGVSIPEGSFEPPPNATRATPWQRLKDRLGEHQSIEDVRTETSIAEPSVPERFEFEWGNVTKRNGTERAVLLYGDGNVKLELIRWDNSSLNPLRRGESVQIGSTQGLFVAYSQSRYVQWTCDGYTYLIRTRADREVTLETARSIGC